MGADAKVKVVSEFLTCRGDTHRLAHTETPQDIEMKKIIRLMARRLLAADHDNTRRVLRIFGHKEQEMFSALRRVAASVLCAAASFAASAAPNAAVEWNGNPQFVFTNGPWMMGYEFNVSTSVTVTALGAFDDQGDGFVTGHQVGIWDSSGSLLASTTVSSADPLIGHFRYANIAPVVLAPGNGYVVGADLWGGNYDPWAWRETGGMGLIEAAGIDHIQDRFNSGTGFGFPGSSEGTFRDGFFGGNFLIETGAAPEPGTLALLGLGLAGLAAARRRKQ